MTHPEIPNTFTNLNAQQNKPGAILDSLLYSATALPGQIQKPKTAEDKAPPLPAEAFEAGDIDAFLGSETKLYMLCEGSWHSVAEKIDRVREIVSGDVYVETTIRGKYVLKPIDENTTNEQRRTGGMLGVAYTAELLRSVRARVTNDYVDEVAQNLSKGIKNDDNLERLSSHALEHAPRQSVRDQHLDKLEESEPQAQLLEMVGELHHAYTIAFAFQQIAIDRISNMLGNDANVMPFIERLNTILDLRDQGVDEFIGLPEIMNVMMQLQQVTQGSSDLEKAMYRVAPQTYDAASFTERVLTSEKADIEGQSHPGFRNMVLGAKLVAQAIALDGETELSTQDLSQIIARHISSLDSGDTWAKAHEADANSRARADWRRLSRRIQRYECRGRIPDIAVSTKTTAMSRGPKSKASQKMVRPRSTDDLQQLITTDARKLPVLGIMKQMGNTRVYKPEPLEGIDAFLDHGMLQKFLESHPEAPYLSDALRRFTGCLQQAPSIPTTTRLIKHRRFSIDAEGFPQQSFALRRFKPDTHAMSGIQPHPLHDRIRIIFGLVPGRETSYLLVKNVTLRDDDTYSKL